MKAELNSLRKIFNKVDPMGIYFEEAPQEYDPEINELLSALPDFNNVQDIGVKLKDIFSRYLESVKVDQRRLDLLTQRLRKIAGHWIFLISKKIIFDPSALGTATQ